MDDGRWSEGAVPGRSYVLGMIDRGTHAEVVLYDAERFSTGRAEEVWVHRFPTMRSAARLFLAMLPHPARWGAWARMASIMGADFVLGLVSAEVEAATSAKERRARDARRLDESRRRRERLASRISVWPVLHGAKPRIVAVRGDVRAVLLELETVDDVLRVWDWLRWQSRSVVEWLRVLEAEGADALRVVILRGMVADERRFKAEGLARQRDRPLRFWRPEAKRRGEGSA